MFSSVITQSTGCRYWSVVICPGMRRNIITREYHFWEWNYPTVLAKENSRKLRESYLKKKLQEIEDELKKLED